MDPFLLEKNGGGAIGARSKLKITAIQTRTGNTPVRLIASPQNLGTLRRRLGVLPDRWRDWLILSRIHHGLSPAEELHR